MINKIESVYYYISIDENGNEGTMGYFDQSTKSWFPLIATSERLAKIMYPQAEFIARQSNCTFKVLKFDLAKDVTNLLN